jgi:hypothetical protein
MIFVCELPFPLVSAQKGANVPQLCHVYMFKLISNKLLYPVYIFIAGKTRILSSV